MSSRVVLPISGLVVFGTFTSLAAKIVYELDGVGLDGKTKNFEKPWAMTTVMFVGMTFCLPIAYLLEYRADRKEGKTISTTATDSRLEGTAAQPLLSSSSDRDLQASSNQKSLSDEIREILLLSIPTFFDLIATVLMNIGLLHVTASVYQMLRGAEMLFAALFAVLFLKRKLNRFHYGGIGCCITGITLVGTSSLLSGEGSATHQVNPANILFGMALIIASQAVQAAQITFEDFFMADMAIAPMKIVGFEGLFGTVAMACVMLPLVQKLPGIDGQGIHEDSKDTWHMIMNNPTIARILLLDMTALLLYNVAGMMVTGHLGAVFRTVLETTRTLFVWLIDLFLFYTPFGMGKLGERWSTYSWVQAVGFVILVAGTVIYGKGDEKEVAQDIVEGLYDDNDSDAIQTIHTDVVPLPSSLTAHSAVDGGYSVAIPGRGLRTTGAIGVAQASSLKSSMNMNAFGSIPSSLPRSLRHR